MSDLFTCNGFTAESGTEARASAPAEIFFLTPDFITKYYQLAALPPEQLPGLLEFAEKLHRDKESRALMWHLYKAYCIFNRPVADFPELLEPFGIDSGKIYLLIMFTLLPLIEDRAVRENFPLKYARAAAERINSTTIFFAQKYQGAFGLLAKSLGFMRSYKDHPLFRIGRFDFDMTPFNDFMPEIYRNRDGKIIALCQDNWMFDRRGERTLDPADAVQKTSLIHRADSVTGTPVDTVNGYAEKAGITLDTAEWEKVFGPGDWAIHFHIPGGGGMTPELCAASFAEGKAFFDSYFPDKPAKVIWTNSWFMNPAYKEYMPNSNIAKLSSSGCLFPVFSSGKDGLMFVFGREDENFAGYEVKTSLQKAVMRCREERGFLRRAGWFMIP